MPPSRTDGHGIPDPEGVRQLSAVPRRRLPRRRLPSLLLHTVGAKTGKARTTSLTYARDNTDYLVVASNGGSPRSPGWYHNLKADPDIEINVGPKRFAVTAQPVLPGDPDRERLWKIVTKYNKSYNEYQKKTRRPIPIVRLTPKA